MSNLEPLVWCWTVGDKPPSLRVFHVQISHEVTVGELKKAIKEEKRVDFDQIDADSLDLYEISVAEDNMDTELSNINLDSLKGNELRSMHRLSQVFPDPPTDGHLHIIIIKLPGGECN
jgi:acyl carrier protein